MILLLTLMYLWHTFMKLFINIKILIISFLFTNFFICSNSFALLIFSKCYGSHVQTVCWETAPFLEKKKKISVQRKINIYLKWAIVKLCYAKLDIVLFSENPEWAYNLFLSAEGPIEPFQQIFWVSSPF